MDGAILFGCLANCRLIAPFRVGGGAFSGASSDDGQNFSSATPVTFVAARALKLNTGTGNRVRCRASFGVMMTNHGILVTRFLLGGPRARAQHDDVLPKDLTQDVSIHTIS
jgi:hypothetical protein